MQERISAEERQVREYFNKLDRFLSVSSKRGSLFCHVCLKLIDVGITREFSLIGKEQYG
jgi:hypothetical protein